MRLLFLLLNIVSFSDFGANSFFGQKIKGTKNVSLSQAIENFSTYENKKIVLTGNVSKICVKKGCWMELKDEEAKVRVTFKDYGFFVPVKLQDKRVNVEGLLNVKTESVAEIKHYLEDEGAGREKVNAVKAPKKIYHFLATGVEQL